MSSAQTYYAYGAVRTTSGTLPTDYTFTGQRVDASAGLMYYGARYYDPSIGRFTQPDTLVPNLYNPQHLNRYTYVYNNPLKYTDPSGHGSPWDDFWTWAQQSAQKLIALLQQPLRQAYNSSCGGTVDPNCGRGTSIPTSSSDLLKTVGQIGQQPTFGPGITPGVLKALELSQAAVGIIEKYSIKSYKDYTSDDKQGKPAHHLVEKRFWRQLGFNSPEQAEAEILAVIIEQDLHGPRGKGQPTITDMIRDQISYQLGDDASLREIWRVHRDVYERFEHKDWSELIWEAYFKSRGIP